MEDLLNKIKKKVKYSVSDYVYYMSEVTDSPVSYKFIVKEPISDVTFTVEATEKKIKIKRKTYTTAFWGNTNKHVKFYSSPDEIRNSNAQYLFADVYEPESGNITTIEGQVLVSDSEEFDLSSYKPQVNLQT